MQIKSGMKILVVGSALLLSLGTGSAFAKISAEGWNDTTGPHSENTNDWNIDREIDIEVQNDAELNNVWHFDVNTGENSINCNTVVEDVSTGDIEAEVEVENNLNSGDIDLGDLVAMGDVEVELGNYLTGPNSENENEVNIDANVDVNIENNADINNNFHINANTGRNEVEHNTQVGDIETGDIEMEINAENRVNSGAGNIDLGNLSTDVEADFSNELTGPNSQNSNELNLDSEINVDIQNDANIENHVCVEANTGANEISNNTVVGDISTGSVEFNMTTTNVAN